MSKTITIPSWKSFMYSRVYEITEFKDGCVFKTRDTGLCVDKDYKLPPNYDRCNFSTDELKQETITIEVADKDEIN